jgi:hypothetical protein
MRQLLDAHPTFSNPNNLLIIVMHTRWTRAYDLMAEDSCDLEKRSPKPVQLDCRRAPVHAKASKLVRVLNDLSRAGSAVPGVDQSAGHEALEAQLDTAG